MTTRTRALALAVVMAAVSARVPASDPAGSAAERAAESSATAWLALVDAGKYGQSWNEAAAVFRSALTKAQWEAALDKARKPLGKVLSRKLSGAKYTTELPSAPAGEYVVIQYETKFEGAPSATETITPMREKDGSWKVSGYYIR